MSTYMDLAGGQDARRRDETNQLSDHKRKRMKKNEREEEKEKRDRKREKSNEEDATVRE